jgi:inhibitor of cysteine peptidase
MFTKFTLALVTLILLFSLAGCGIANPSGLTPNLSPDDAQNSPSESSSAGQNTENSQMLPVISAQTAAIKLDASANGTTQTLKKGEVMSITLESNSSTGYSWVASISDTAVVSQAGEPQYNEPASSATPVVGAAGSQTFLFQGVSAGTAALTLDYERPWETDVAPVQSIVITVNVQ